jgi:hypothetical protein
MQNNVTPRPDEGIGVKQIARWVALTVAMVAGVVVVGPSSQAVAAKSLSGAVSLDHGAAYATSVEVTVTSAVRGGTEMRLKNDGGEYSKWEPYSHSRPWALTPGDGVKTVEVQYKGATGTRLTLSATIILDTMGPTVTVDYDTLTGRHVCVAISAVDAWSGVAGTWFRLDGGEWCEGDTARYWVQVKRSGSSGEEAGTHVLEYRAVDLLGNASEVESLVITLQ